jgi:hypothetical protein
VSKDGILRAQGNSIYFRISEKLPDFKNYNHGVLAVNNVKLLLFLAALCLDKKSSF